MRIACALLAQSSSRVADCRCTGKYRLTLSTAPTKNGALTDARMPHCTYTCYMYMAIGTKAKKGARTGDTPSVETSAERPASISAVRRAHSAGRYGDGRTPTPAESWGAPSAPIACVAGRPRTPYSLVHTRLLIDFRPESTQPSRCACTVAWQAPLTQGLPPESKVRPGCLRRRWRRRGLRAGPCAA